MKFGKTIVRAGVITALVGGAALVVAGPDRISALIHQTRDEINQTLDRHIEDPVALRAQIRGLEATYPKKIAEVSADLTEVRGQIDSLERERQVAAKVIELARGDLDEIDTILAHAEGVRQTNPGAIVRVSFTDGKMSVDEAMARRARIASTADMYTQRAAELGTDLEYLREQEDQLADLLVRLETERSEFQAKLVQLDAQIDAIARNKRMISMIEKRQATIDEHSRYQAHSLDQLDKQLATIRAQQRAQLKAITGRDRGADYVDRAKFLLDTGTDGVSDAATPIVVEPEVIEVGPETSKPVASR